MTLKRFWIVFAVVGFIVAMSALAYVLPDAARATFWNIWIGVIVVLLLAASVWLFSRWIDRVNAATKREWQAYEFRPPAPPPAKPVASGGQSSTIGSAMVVLGVIWLFISIWAAIANASSSFHEDNAVGATANSLRSIQSGIWVLIGVMWFGLGMIVCAVDNLNKDD